MNDVFQYVDTNSSRAGVSDLNKVFYEKKIAIIGLGGTGSYILDLVAKTPVSEIHLFDGDTYELHNAFRTPGATAIEEFREGLMKVDYYHQHYSRIHKNIKPHGKYVDSEVVKELNAIDFCFIAIDSNPSRHEITSGLLALKVPFIDCGIGIQRHDNSLIGMIRITTCTNTYSTHLQDRIGREDFDVNEYTPNIQMAEINSVNAAFAVLKWKKLCGYYQDLKKEHNSVLTLNTLKIFNDDFES